MRRSLVQRYDNNISVPSHRFWLKAAVVASEAFPPRLVHGGDYVSREGITYTWVYMGEKKKRTHATNPQPRVRQKIDIQLLRRQMSAAICRYTYMLYRGQSGDSDRACAESAIGRL